MGEAIARFRGLMVSAQRYADEYHSQPRATVTAHAAEKFAKECREHLLEHEKSGMVWPERYIRGLCRRRDEAEKHVVPPPPGCFDMPEYIEWVPEPRGFYPSESEVVATLRNAVREAVKWGSLFSEVEARIKALEAAADMMIQFAAVTYHSGPNPPDSDKDDDVYVTYRLKFAEALDALAPFIEEPPADTGLSPKQKTSAAKQPTKRSRKGIGGRPEKFTMKFIREVVAARERDEKQAAKARMPLPSKAEWLSDYCSATGIDLRKQFPPATPGEEWRLRANRFWKAATKRLREAETNRH